MAPDSPGRPPAGLVSKPAQHPRADHSARGIPMTARRLLAAGPLLALALLVPATTRGTADDKDDPAAKALNRDNDRHKKFLEIVAKGEADVIFLGDSITQGWEGAGKKVWAEQF